MGQGFVKKDVARRGAHDIEHRIISYPLVNQPLHQPVTGALGCHTDPGKQ
jgi:hypothetical protein